MSALLSELGLAWQQPVHGAQQAFRALLAAMAHPGRVHSLPAAAVAGVQPPATRSGPGMSIAAAVSLLTLLDAESSVHFVDPADPRNGAGPQQPSALAGYFRFHCGVRSAALDQAQFVYARAGDADAGLCGAMQQGSDAAPQDGATLVLDLDGFASGAGPGERQSLRLRGPGVQSETLLQLQGSLPALWQWRARQADALPRGIDLLLCSGDRLAAIPRSTLLALETTSCI